jgi:hypothetical protein
MGREGLYDEQIDEDSARFALEFQVQEMIDAAVNVPRPIGSAEIFQEMMARHSALSPLFILTAIERVLQRYDPTRTYHLTMADLAACVSAEAQASQRSTDSNIIAFPRTRRPHGKKRSEPRP